MERKAAVLPFRGWGGGLGGGFFYKFLGLCGVWGGLTMGRGCCMLWAEGGWMDEGLEMR